MLKQIQQHCQKEFDSNTLKALEGFVSIKAITPDFDKDWEANGLLTETAKYFSDWVKLQNIKGLKLEILKDPGYTPFIFIEIDPSSPEIKKSFGLYAHLDKMPPLNESLWTSGALPYQSKIIDGYLYGRGVLDDGYAPFCFISVIKIIQELNLPHGKIYCLFEFDEESSGDHIKYYITKLYNRIKDINILIASDAGGADFERLWITSSLRGNIRLNLKAKLIEEPVHSVDGGGVIPDTLRIIRILLSRLEDEETGKMIDELNPPIPPKAIKEAEESYKLIWDAYLSKFNRIEGSQIESYRNTNPIFEAFLNRAWRSSLTIVGGGLLPPLEAAGNIIRSETILTLSIRTAPHLILEKAHEIIKERLTLNSPYGAKMTLFDYAASEGVYLKPLSSQILNILNECSQNIFGSNIRYMNEGGSIPFLTYFNKQFPNSEIISSGATGPNCCEHAPNERLNLLFTKQYMSCIAFLITEYSIK